MDIISFTVSGSFAAFRDPSVTSHQTVSFIPSKSAVIGIIGAIIGVKRSNSLAELYSSEYLELYKNTLIGLRFESEPKKVVYFTNHRSLKEAKTKPVKSELVDSPRYTIFVSSDKNTMEKLENTIRQNKFSFSPYLGHAYCPCVVSDLKFYQNVMESDAKNNDTSCVILDESETYSDTFKIDLGGKDENSHVIIERHLHHFFSNNEFQSRVLKHWIPIKSVFTVNKNLKPKLSKFVKISDGIVCLY
ncbi:MAG: CRISPR-associated protein Cas5 [Thaumarchaeota archaeon]|nr:CRISPR-associated protein Cas5 [Nitrososphaerota archaeon]